MMCVSSKVLWCFVLLLTASSLESQENSTNDDKQRDSSMVRYDLLVNSLKYRNDEIKSTQCNSSENFIKSDNEMQYEPHINSTKNEKENNLERYEFRGHIIKDCEESNQMSIEFTAINSTEINDSMVQEIKNLFKIESKTNSTLHKHENSKKNIKTVSIVPYEKCHNITCVQLCCPFRNYLSLTGKCVAINGSFYLPKLDKHKNDFDDPLFYLTVRNPCISQGFGRRLLPFNEYLFLTDGSLYQGPNKFILPSDFCLASFNKDIYEVIVCTNQTKYPIYVSACLLVSLPFLLLTFVVYSILPELQNIHGYTMRAYIVSLFITYTIMYCGQQVSGLQQVGDETCVILAYIFNFFFLSSFFWLNVICFDIWRTFRKIRPYRANRKQVRKKFVRYSIYAWGAPLILIVICFIMDHVDKIPENWIRPEICVKKFWFSNIEAKTKYFYVPIVAIVISNSYLFIHTTVSIMYQNKQIAHQLRISDSMFHNRNKLRFKTFLRLFVMMGYGGIIWIIKIIAWLNDDHLPSFIWYPTDMINSLQGFIIFIIFVCSKKIKKLLLKRFGGQKCGPFFMIPTYNDSRALNITSPHRHRQRYPRKKNRPI